MSDAGSRDIAKLFGLVRVNAISFVVTPAFHNHQNALNLYNGDVIIVYYNSKEYRNLTYAGGIQQGKYCMHLNPFTIGSKYISLKGSTKEIALTLTKPNSFAISLEPASDINIPPILVLVP